MLTTVLIFFFPSVARTKHLYWASCIGTMGRLKLPGRSADTAREHADGVLILTGLGIFDFRGLRLAAWKHDVSETHSEIICTNQQVHRSTIIDMMPSLLFNVSVTVSLVLALSNSLPSSLRNRSGSSWNIHRSVLDEMVHWIWLGLQPNTFGFQ